MSEDNFDFNALADAGESRIAAGRLRKVEDAAVTVRAVFKAVTAGRRDPEVLDAIVAAAKGKEVVRRDPRGGGDKTEDGMVTGLRLMAESGLTPGQTAAIRRIVNDKDPGYYETTPNGDGTILAIPKLQQELKTEQVKNAGLTDELVDERNPNKVGSLAHQLAGAKAAITVDTAAAILDLDAALKANGEVHTSLGNRNVVGRDKVETAIKAAKTKLTLPPTPAPNP